MPMPGRQYNAGDYRYGFNGKEDDNELEGQQDYGLRMYDKRLARFKSVDPLAASYPMLSTYQFASNTPIWALDLDGAEAWIYTETDGVGHTFIVVPSAEDPKEMVVYSFGRYNGSTMPSLGGFGPVGDGVLIRKEGQSAKDFIKERLSLGGGSSTFVFELPKADANDIRKYYDKMFNSGKPLPEGSKARETYGEEGKIVDQYRLIPMMGQSANNCVTKTCEGIIEGEALDEFTPLPNGKRYDGGAYQDLKNQLDPKAFGDMLRMMLEFDKKNNTKDRNIEDVTKEQKKEYGVET